MHCLWSTHGCVLKSAQSSTVVQYNTIQSRRTLRCPDIILHCPAVSPPRTVVGNDLFLGACIPRCSSFRRLPSKINPAVVGLRPRDQARAGAAAAAGLTSSSTAVATTTTSSTARSSSDSLAGPLARGGEASDTISGMRAHEPTDASVVNQLLSELTDALAPPASLSTASAGLVSTMSGIRMIVDGCSALRGGGGGHFLEYPSQKNSSPPVYIW